MLTRKEVIKSPKKGHALHENAKTQPFKHQKVFGNPKVLANSWYIICPSKDIKKEQTKSFNILKQRIAIFRGKSGKLSALDAFCPHMGVDLGNGIVKNESLQCILHNWKFNDQGNLIDTPCDMHNSLKEKISLNRYPVAEQLGFIWVFSAKTASHDIPLPIDIGNEDYSSVFLREVHLKVHPHILMINAVDLLHFKTLHKINAEILYSINGKKSEQRIWDIKLKLKDGNILVKLAKLLVGDEVSYKVVYAGGTITGVSVKMPGLLGSKGPSLPSINILWASKPNIETTGSIYNFLVVKKYSGIFAPIKRGWAYLISLFVLTALRDDDFFVFPNMRFSLKYPCVEDKSALEYINFINSLPTSDWADLAHE